MKKLIAALSIFFLCSANVSAIDFANDEAYLYGDTETFLEQEVAFTQSELLYIENGDTYVEQIDAIVTKLAKTPSKLEKLHERILKVEEKLYESSEEYTTPHIILSYLKAKIEYELFMIEEAKKEAERANAPKNYAPISDKEKADVEKELAKLQNNIVNETNTLIETMIADFKELSQYEEKGDLEMSFNFNSPEVGSINSEFEIKDYVARANQFDSDFSGHVSAMIEASFQGAEEMKFELDSFLDFISKDGNMYILVDKLKTESSDESFNFFTDILKKMEEEGKFIRLEDAESQAALGFLKSLPSNADSFNIPMFEAYGKDGNDYLVRPTKEACDMFKEISQVFDPFSGSECTERQYKKFLNEMEDAGVRMYFRKGNLRTLGIKQEDEFDMTVRYNSTRLASVSMIVKDLGTVNYVADSHIVLDIETETSDIDVDIQLGNASSLESIEATGNMDTTYSDTTFEFTLKNRDFSGTWNTKSQSIDWENYDWETGGEYTYVDSYETNIVVKGGIKRDNSLSSIDMTITGKDLRESNSYYEIAGKYDGLNITASMKAVVEGEEFFTLNSSGQAGEKFVELDTDFTMNIRALGGFYADNTIYMGDIYFLYDGRMDKNNMTLNADIMKDGEEENIIELRMKNTGTRTLRNDIEIEAPTEFTNFEDLMPSIYDFEDSYNY